jgi:hypothetical protein
MDIQLLYLAYPKGRSMTLRALGGGTLLGSNLGRFVYLDEAGVSSQQQEPWLVVAGLLVHADTQLNRLYKELESVAERHIPEGDRKGLVLHTSDIYGGNGKVFDEARNPYWTYQRRMAILEDLAEIPNKTNIFITGIPIERAKFPANIELPSRPSDGRKRAGKPRKPPTLTVLAHASAYIACLFEVDQWLGRNAKGENCMVIVEDNNESRAAIRQVHRYCLDGSMPFFGDLKNDFPFKRVREDPAFQEKTPDHPLVLSDFVAFVLKRRQMKDDRISPYFAPWKERYEALHWKGREH